MKQKHSIDTAVGVLGALAFHVLLFARFVFNARVSAPK
jgi:hypothetical protein